ncbi:NAD(P)H-hydrate epimerase [Oceanospirillum multiglobuliferum]|uniref:Bifunctional NAD(P)H-hydrate repair enzyme n=1 Tax=Oceanospirillum multiglobuliferum TaxID=64969 RepID=A0A1T4RIJ9_9GAMM|nr:NAD(P)H-hydrate dehydratase [Oceanospirillum multiglobuliferum]OPX54786.1 hypothetical protein BTE48_12240 [Oceanospirillum multiglobuliferum]SKA15521.1 NAD(P)H-hydrate epimerase [Oceanospirillum multiglobuliferum]
MKVWPIHERLYSAAQVKQLDQLTIQSGTAGFELMKQAGRTAFRHLLRKWPNCASVTLFCGSGNNAGDGYVMAVLAKKQGLQVQLVAVTDPEYLKGEAQEAYQWALSCGLSAQSWPISAESIEGDVIVDALLGTGLTGEVRAPFSEVIELINQHPASVLSVDIPSGLCADRGAVLGCAVKADLTVTFIGKKLGLWTGQGPALCGERRFEPLLVPDSVRQLVPMTAQMVNPESIPRLLKPRSRTSHKGDHGRVLVVGGDYGYAGAILLAAQCAARSGAGLVKVMTRPEHVAALVARQPELMVEGITSVHQLDQWLSWCDVVVLGPGLGQKGWGQQIWHKVMQANCPKVLDADALNLMASKKAMLARLQAEGLNNWVLTPHPGEAARMLQSSVAEVESDRPLAVANIQRHYGGVVLLKGAGTLIRCTDRLSVNNSGNPGMASGGMGDVLSGLIAALLAQGLAAYEATCLAAQVHGLAADQLAKQFGERGLLAADLIQPIRVLLNPECELNAV